MSLIRDLKKANEKYPTVADPFIRKIVEQGFMKLDENSVIDRMGLGTALKTQQRKITKELEKESSLLSFPQEGLYNVRAVKKMAVEYRLRFLDIKRYNNIATMPQTVFSEIEVFEQKILGRELDKRSDTLKILAPAENFNLDLKPRRQDPMLFYKISTGQYYLIHKWGNDIGLGRKIKMFFLRSAKHMRTLSVIVSTIILLPIMELFRRHSHVFHDLLSKNMDTAVGAIVLLAVICFIAYGGLLWILSVRYRSIYSNDLWQSTDNLV